MKRLATGILASIALVACGSSSTSNTNSSQPSSSSTPSPSATAQASPTSTAVPVTVSCHFTASVQPQGSYTGHSVDSVALTNAGQAACTLNGYPQVVLKDGSGQPAGISQIDGQGQAATATPAAINVAPGQSANFVMEFSDISGSGACPQVAGAGITLPGSGGQVSVTFNSGFMPCPPSFNVGAITG